MHEEIGWGFDFSPAVRRSDEGGFGMSLLQCLLKQEDKVEEVSQTAGFEITWFKDQGT